MAVKFELVKAGDILWDVHSERAGNTTGHRIGSWRVRVISIDYVNAVAMCSWNGNAAERYYRTRLEKLRRIPHKTSHSYDAAVKAEKNRKAKAKATP